MKNIIALSLILFLLNFNAQKDFVDKYDIKSYVNDNIKLIKNTNTEKVKDRIKFNYSLSTHIIRNSGLIDSYLYQFRINKELKLKMSENENHIKLKKKNKFFGVTLISGFLSSLYFLSQDDVIFGIVAFIVILPITALLALFSQRGTSELKAQLLKDYFLLINQTL